MKQGFLQFDNSVKAVLGSETFKRASKIRNLLEFLADRTAALGAENVTAQLVTTEFFKLTGQQAEKSSIHRVQISRLKTLITNFYRQEGRDQRWQLSILAGCYGLDLVPSADDQSNFSPRLGIIPFQNLGGDSFQHEICIGMAHDLIHMLAQTRTLRLISMTHQMDYSEASRSKFLSVANEYADYVLDGSVRFKPGGYEILSKLTDVKTCQVMWSQKFELPSDPTQLFEFQNEIALKIAASMATPTGIISRMARNKPSDGSAYAAVLHFYAHTEKYTPQSHAIAKASLLSAVQNAPLYAEAWACLSGIYWNEHVFGFEKALTDRKALDESIRCAMHALTLAPDCVTAIYALASSHYQRGEKSLFKEYSSKVLELAPYRSDILAGIGVFTACNGDWEDGLVLMDRARELIPLHPDWYWLPYYANEYRQGNLDKAIDYLSKVNAQAFPHSLLFIAAIQARQGDHPAALKTFSALKKIFPDLSEKLPTYLQRLFPHSEIYNLLLADLLDVQAESASETGSGLSTMNL
jgi:TolB-like protein